MNYTIKLFCQEFLEIETMKSKFPEVFWGKSRQPHESLFEWVCSHKTEDNDEHKLYYLNFGVKTLTGNTHSANSYIFINNVCFSILHGLFSLDFSESFALIDELRKKYPTFFDTLLQKCGFFSSCSEGAYSGSAATAIWCQKNTLIDKIVSIQDECNESLEILQNTIEQFINSKYSFLSTDELKNMVERSGDRSRYNDVTYAGRCNTLLTLIHNHARKKSWFTPFSHSELLMRIQSLNIKRWECNTLKKFIFNVHLFEILRTGPEYSQFDQYVNDNINDCMMLNSSLVDADAVKKFWVRLVNYLSAYESQKKAMDQIDSIESIYSGFASSVTYALGVIRDSRNISRIYLSDAIDEQYDHDLLDIHHNNPVKLCHISLMTHLMRRWGSTIPLNLYKKTIDQIMTGNFIEFFTALASCKYPVLLRIVPLRYRIMDSLTPFTFLLSHSLTISTVSRPRHLDIGHSHIVDGLHYLNRLDDGSNRIERNYMDDLRYQFSLAKYDQSMENMLSRLMLEIAEIKLFCATAEKNILQMQNDLPAIEMKIKAYFGAIIALIKNQMPKVMPKQPLGVEQDSNLIYNEVKNRQLSAIKGLFIECRGLSHETCISDCIDSMLKTLIVHVHKYPNLLAKLVSSMHEDQQKPNLKQYIDLLRNQVHSQHDYDDLIEAQSNRVGLRNNQFQRDLRKFLAWNLAGGFFLHKKMTKLGINLQQQNASSFTLMRYMHRNQNSFSSIFRSIRSVLHIESSNYHQKIIYDYFINRDPYGSILILNRDKYSHLEHFHKRVVFSYSCYNPSRSLFHLLRSIQFCLNRNFTKKELFKSLMLLYKEGNCRSPHEKGHYQWLPGNDKSTRAVIQYINFYFVAVLIRYALFDKILKRPNVLEDIKKKIRSMDAVYLAKLWNIICLYSSNFETFGDIFRSKGREVVQYLSGRNKAELELLMNQNFENDESALNKVFLLHEVFPRKRKFNDSSVKTKPCKKKKYTAHNAFFNSGEQRPLIKNTKLPPMLPDKITDKIISYLGSTWR